MQSSRLYFKLLALTALSLSCHSAVSFCGQDLSAQAWGRVALSSVYEHVQAHEPTSDGSVVASPDDDFHLSPEFNLGLNTSYAERLKVNSLLAFQQRYISAGENLFPSPFASQTDYPQIVVEESLALNLSLHLFFTPYFCTGLSTEGAWSRIRWKNMSWERTTRVQASPWIGVIWSREQQSYLSSIFVRKLSPFDPEQSYKMDIEPFQDLTFRLSHIYSPLANLRLAGEVHSEKLLFADFWLDHSDQGLSVGAEWALLSTFSVSTHLGMSHRKFLIPWKRMGPCHQSPQERDSDYYSRDPQDCHRWEREYSWDLGLNWRIFHEFRLSGILGSSGIQASEPEFATLKKRFFLLVSWETDTSVFSDPLRNFFPWVYRSRMYEI